MLNPSHNNTFENEGSSFNNTKINNTKRSNKCSIEVLNQVGKNGIQMFSKALQKKEASLKELQSKLSTNYNRLVSKLEHSQMQFEREQQIREGITEHIGTIFSSCIKEEVSEDEGTQISYDKIRKNVLESIMEQRQDTLQPTHRDFVTAENSPRRSSKNRRSMRSSIS